MRSMALVCVIALVSASSLSAQTSVYGVSGLGYPTSPWSARARATGGSLGPLDPSSAVNPAGTAGFRSLAVSVMGGTQFRNYETSGIKVGGLKSTRVPLAMLGGPLGGTPFAFALSFSTYLDRSFDLITRDTLILRGDSVPVVDRRQSDGGIIDLRGAMGWLISDRVWVGAAVHVLSGSTRRGESRDYQIDEYTDLVRQEDVAFRGVAGSLGVVANPTSWLRAGLSYRVAGAVTSSVDGQAVARTPMPHELSMGVILTPHVSIRLATAATRRTWSRVAGLSQGPISQSFDTWDIGSGIEFGSQTLPLRAGVRYTQLPFSPTANQPREFAFAAGSGFRFARGRASMDITVERILREGGGVTERAWQMHAELRIRP